MGNPPRVGGLDLRLLKPPFPNLGRWCAKGKVAPSPDAIGATSEDSD